MVEKPKRLPDDTSGEDEFKAGGLHALPPEPAPQQPTPEQLDEDERELAALRIDLPGAAGSPPSGIISIGVSDKLPKSEFIRARADTVVMNMLPQQVGMEREFYAVRPEMITPLAGIGIDVVAYRLYLIITTEGAVRPDVHGRHQPNPISYQNQLTNWNG